MVYFFIIMYSLKEHFITEVVRQAIKNAPTGQVVRVMDLGCGSASYAKKLLEQFPDVQYVGVEPIDASFKKAQQNLDGVQNVTLHNQLGYDSVPEATEASFDAVFSLSVLEHIKHLDRFIAMSAKYVKQGGLMVHRYDLGHALYSHSVKEWLHVKVGNNFPQILPERQFVRYVPQEEVRELFTKNGVTPTKTTYHQMPNHKSLEKSVINGGDVVEELFTWEMKHQEVFKNLELSVQEKLFPAIAIWGKK